MKIGTILTTTETKAYWGYCEVGSARFGAAYQTRLPAPLYAHIVGGGAFAQLGPQDHQYLIAALYVARNPAFVASLDPHPRYGVREWDKLTLARWW